MTPEFDQLCESLINEYTTAKSKRVEARYKTPTLQPRKISNKGNMSGSQATKAGNQQYIGDPWGHDGIRGQNKSERDLANAGIMKGLGGHLRVKGTNPKNPGAAINSKTGDMIVKYNLANGVSKVGSRLKRDYSKNGIRKPFLADHKKKFPTN